MGSTKQNYGEHKTEMRVRRESETLTFLFLLRTHSGSGIIANHT